MFDDPLEGGIVAFEESTAFIASTGNLPLVGLTAFEGNVGDEGLVDVEKRGVVGLVKGEAAEKAEAACSESLVFVVFIELVL